MTCMPCATLTPSLTYCLVPLRTRYNAHLATEVAHQQSEDWDKVSPLPPMGNKVVDKEPLCTGYVSDLFVEHIRTR